MIFEERNIVMDSISDRIKRDCELYSFQIHENDMEIYLFDNRNNGHNILLKNLSIDPTISLYDLGLSVRIYGELGIHYNSAICLSSEITCDCRIELNIMRNLHEFKPLKIVSPQINIMDMDPANWGWSKQTELDSPFVYIDSVRGVQGLKLKHTKFLSLSVGDIYSSNFIDRQDVEWNDELLVVDLRKRYQQGQPMSEASRIVWFRDGFECAQPEKHRLSKMHNHYIGMYKWCVENLAPILVPGWVGYNTNSFRLY